MTLTTGWFFKIKINYGIFKTNRFISPQKEFGFWNIFFEVVNQLKVEIVQCQREKNKLLFPIRVW